MTRRILTPCLAVFLLGACSLSALAVPASTHPAAIHSAEAPGISIFWSVPFVLLLGSIALMPFIARHWWEKSYPWVSGGLALLVAIYYIFFRREPLPWLGEMKEYVSFIILLASLYMVSGGISIRINRRATPLANVTLLLIGAVLANIFGTTGAGMLLIRPFMRMNRGHIKPYHIVFFIFIVANVGGSLTPIGDPPLFLGYLKGVPFWWVAEHMAAPWFFAVGMLLAIFLVIDTLDHRKSERSREGDSGAQVHILGIHNFLFIGVVILGVFRPSIFEVTGDMLDAGWSTKGVFQIIFSREVLMLAAAIVSRRVTGGSIYQANDFSFGPIREVAILFVGIFSTMVPALHWLEHNAEKLAIRTPGQFYYATGSLSAVLDNAPTYLTFLKLRLGELDSKDVDEVQRVLHSKRNDRYISLERHEFESDEAMGAAEAMLKYHEPEIRRGHMQREQLEVAFLIGSPAMNIFVLAISAGSVFWGACTYIGNGPNFMVKAIAETAGVRTPAFLEYVYKYALPILIPIYVMVWVIFFL
jgi:Na+/H+ antiporter NhaD/arsenite permease-like protein